MDTNDDIDNTGIEETAHAEDTAFIQPPCAGEVTSVIVVDCCPINQELSVDYVPATKYNTEQDHRNVNRK